MSFSEVDILGVYVSPMSVMMLASWLITMLLLRLASKSGVLRYAWHPALFVLSIYLIVLSSITLIVAAE